MAKLSPFFHSDSTVQIYGCFNNVTISEKLKHSRKFSVQNLLVVLMLTQLHGDNTYQGIESQMLDSATVLCYCTSSCLAKHQGGAY